MKEKRQKIFRRRPTMTNTVSCAGNTTHSILFSQVQQKLLHLAEFQGTSVVHSHGFFLSTFKEQTTFQTRSFHGVPTSSLTLTAQTRMGRISDGLPFFLRTGSQMTDHPLSNTVRQGSSETRHGISGTCTPKRVQPSPFSCSSYWENSVGTIERSLICAQRGARVCLKPLVCIIFYN